jgi:hypothetical protein
MSLMPRELFDGPAFMSALALLGRAAAGAPALAAINSERLT